MKTHRVPSARPRRTALAALCACSFAAAVRAQTAPPADQEVVKLSAYEVTTTLGSYVDTTSAAATKMPVAMQDLPSSVQVLNANFMNDVRAQRLDDLYPYVVGMYRDQSLQANGFSLRGFSSVGSNLTSVQVDNLPGLASRFGSPPTADVERVEIIKGPTSVFYGQANPGGLINIITKSPKEISANSFTTFLSTYDSPVSGFGDRLSWTATLDSTGPIDAGKHWLYRVVGSYERDNLFRDYDYLHNVYLFPSLTYRWDARTWITMKIDYTRETRQSNDGLAVPDNNLALLPPINVTYTQPGDTDKDAGEALELNFHHQLSRDWTLRVNTRSVYHDDTRYALEAVQGKITSAALYTNSTISRRFRDQVNGRRYNFLDANLYGSLGPASFRHTLIFGVNGGKEFSDLDRLSFGPTINPPVNLYQSVPDTSSYPAPLASSLNDRKTNFYNYGAYASDSMKIGQKWFASAGVRHDEQDAASHEVYSNKGHKQVDAATVPSFGLLFQPVPSVSLYADYSRSFKPQSVDFVNAVGSPGFPPETGNQIETGVKFETADHNLTATLAVYDIKKQNVLESTGKSTPQGDTIYELTGGQESKGVEFTTVWLPVPNWQVQLGYTYIDARVTQSLTPAEDGLVLENVPHNGGSLWTRYNFATGALKGFGAGFGEIYVGSRVGYANGGISGAPMAEPGYARTDLAFYYQWRRTYFSLNVQNLLDRRYIASAYYNSSVIPGDPRRITFSVRVDF